MEQTEDFCDTGGIQKKADELLQRLLAKGMRQKLIKDRRYLLKNYPTCFVGSQFVEFILDNNEASTIEDSVKLGQFLMDNDLLHHVHDEHKFENQNLFYRLRIDEPNKFVGPSAASVRAQCGAITGSVFKKGLIFWSPKFLVFTQADQTLYVFNSELDSSPNHIIFFEKTSIKVREAPDYRSGFYTLILVGLDEYIFSFQKSKEQEKWLQTFIDAGCQFQKQEEIGLITANSLFELSATPLLDPETGKAGGKPIDFQMFSNRVCLVVNVASQ
eukprot:TRINITY_DN6966_c0_g1_i1.p1 TRINITY_DN6966_c0_g1~~TRINITY_DN6966_c0_g1_i1.p1  ORF type:complete len:272 (+),score=105.10 TRINITY_DN6966_c0_g1_i1:63-878(+)